MRKVFRKYSIKIGLVFVLTLFSVEKSVAQGIGNQILIGINGAQIDGDRLFGYNKAGLTLGWGAFFPVSSEKLKLHFNVLYVQKGAKTKTDPNSLTNALWRQSFHYVDVPIYLEYNVWDKLNLASGFVPGYMIAAQINTGFGNVTNTDEMQRLSMEWMADVNYKVADNVGLGVRFNYSLLSVRQNVGWFNNLMTFYASFYL